MEWTEDLSLGFPTIDSQHKELFRRISNIVAAIKEHRCKDEIDGTIEFLMRGSQARACDYYKTL